MSDCGRCQCLIELGNKSEQKSQNETGTFVRVVANEVIVAKRSGERCIRFQTASGAKNHSNQEHRVCSQLKAGAVADRNDAKWQTPNRKRQ
jgi:hypothetical protein